MKKTMQFIFYILISVTMNSCGGNILTGMSDTTSDAALLYEISLLNNAGDFATALTKYGQLTVIEKAKRETKFLLATVYGGLCGFDFFTFVEALSAGSANNLFKILMDAFPASTKASIDNCILAETAILAIDTNVANRTSDENLFLFFIEMAKMGNILNKHFDTDDDGTVDVGLDACSTTDLPNVTDLYAQHMVTGFAQMSINSAAASDSALSGATAGLEGACTLARDTLGQDICAASDVATVTINEQKVLRSLIKENDSIGIGVNCTGDTSACNCP
ncbi:MAG: hypothetical protein HOO06_06115 [Bdellovibrionaceae bacterium]|jgi:hypothetical protein|nr:hypothetical protein [Pseudobdellovibrionaceae bacterium]